MIIEYIINENCKGPLTLKWNGLTEYASPKKVAIVTQNINQ